MNAIHNHASALTRRHFFRQGALGLGAAALTTLLAQDRAYAQNRGIGGLPHFPPKIKRAIYLFMNGGPSQMDLWDYKPVVRDWYDYDLPESVRRGQRLTTMTSGQARFPLAPSKFSFQRSGQAGTWVSELLPWTQRIVDDLCVIKTVHTEAINHDPAVTYICTGSQIPGRPSLGAWLSYGLGSENENLPDFVVMTPSWTRGNDQALYQRLWGSGFLPARHQGVSLRASGDPVLYLNNPPGVDEATRRRMLDSLARLNQRTAETIGDPETLARIAQYEMAFRMQRSVPDLMNIAGETRQTLDLYGPEVNRPGSFAASCLLARRLAERGVRFIQIFHRGWDQHGNLGPDLPLQCRDVDQACYGLITDLKRRGMLDETLVIWGGEFGRTVYCQGPLSRDNYGRDHHPRCFSMWMAGGGVKAGFVYGETDEFSYNIVENPVHIHSINATILNRYGIDHHRFSVRNQGLDVRLTGVEGYDVVNDILA
ncbi:MAG: DUF1501 domain-containing protein [Gemmataceae bacterium]|nr:DUF1501 domain-containing protein [Gemmataceae bacterium]